MKRRDILELCVDKEGWELSPDKTLVTVHGQQFPVLHPFLIYLRLYRDSLIPHIRFTSFCKAHDYLWPQYIPTNNYWMDRIVEAHTSDGRNGKNHYNQIVLAAGAGAGKSITAGKIATLFWLAEPLCNAVIVASTTLESLEARIWGYVVQLLEEAVLPINYMIRGVPPKCTRKGQKNKIHGIFAVAAREGTEDKTLKTLIGRHPKKRLLMILDEATDINTNIAGSFTNLEQGVEYFQAIAIGNSKDKNDLHGSLATPEGGWSSVSPETHQKWFTKHRNGICVYLNPFDSPAIHEPDPEKKARLSKFLITEEIIDRLVKQYGKESDGYYRFVLGFWRSVNIEQSVVTDEYLKEKEVGKAVHWSGYHQLYPVAGLDPATAAGGRGCILRFAIMGIDIEGNYVLDFRDEELIYTIEISDKITLSAEEQLCAQIIHYLNKHQCPLHYLAIDCTGLGRMLGALLMSKMQLIGEEVQSPLKVVSSRADEAKFTHDPNLLVIPPFQQWEHLKKLIDHRQVKGLDKQTLYQLATRKTVFKNKKIKLEEKEEYIKRMRLIDSANASSPDKADAAALAVMSAIIRRGLKIGARAEQVSRQVARTEVDTKMDEHRAQQLLLQKALGENKPGGRGKWTVPKASFTKGWVPRKW